MKRLALPAVILALLGALAFWWFSPVQVVKRRTANLLHTLTLEAGGGKAGRQMNVYSLNALLAPVVDLENPSISEANGSFERQEMESAYSWLCEQARETRFDLEKLRSITVTGDRAEVSFLLNALVELPNYRPADGRYDVTFHWKNDADEGWRLERAVWKEAGK